MPAKTPTRENSPKYTPIMYYQTRFILLFLILSLVLVFTTCKKDPVSPEEEFFDIEYWFINQGDPDIMAIEILSVTHYPESDSTLLQERNFQRPSLYDTLWLVSNLPGIGAAVALVPNVSLGMHAGTSGSQLLDELKKPKKAPKTATPKFFKLFL